MKTHAGRGLGARVMMTALAALLALPCAIGFSKPPDGWDTDLKAALGQASRNRKPVFAVFSAKGCPPCEHMSEEVLPSPAVKKALAEWNPVYIYWPSEDWKRPTPGSKPPAEFIEYDINVFPTLIMFSPEGEVQLRLDGGRSPSALIKLLKNQPTYVKRKRELTLKLADNKEDPALYKSLGETELLVNDYEAAVDAFKRAAKLDPGNKTGVATDVAFFEALPSDEDDLERSLAALTKFETDNPKTTYNAWARFYRGLITAELGKVDEGIKLLETIAKEYPDSDFAEPAEEALQEMKSGSGQ